MIMKYEILTYDYEICLYVVFSVDSMGDILLYYKNDR